MHTDDQYYLKELPTSSTPQVVTRQNGTRCAVANWGKGDVSLIGTNLYEVTSDLYVIEMYKPDGRRNPYWKDRYTRGDRIRVHPENVD